MTLTSQAAHHIDAKEEVTRTYVLDTSVLLSDPQAMFRFAEHNVVIPIAVVVELEGKRNDPELGYFARRALRHLDDLRVEYGRLDEGMPTPGLGSVRVELNHTNTSSLPSGMRLADTDTRILAVAKNLDDEGKNVTIVAKDLPMRVKASSLGLIAEEYLNDQAVDSGWTGTATVHVSGDTVSGLYEGTVTTIPEAKDHPLNTSLIIASERGSALGRVTGKDGQVRLIKGDQEVFGLRGRSAEQRLAIDMLLDDEVGIVSLGGRAGTGKSALALAAGLEAVLEKKQQKKVIVFRPLYAVGGQELGFLPGDAAEKMNPWGQAIYDALGSFVSGNVLEEVDAQGLLEVLPLTHIRGRSLHDAFVIVDEAQSLERNVLLTVLSRMGQNSRIVLTHDVAQRDNLRVGRHDGIASVVETLKDNALFGHLTLMKSERSAIAALVTDLLERGELT
ncbi:PhoH family protein [Microbacterium sp. 77mftsu3.1]|uniref:PhoH family protein n=1 Tax=Microbacterium sp. 77mftsu3.1 TaxID=1761802 RepID=UPI00037F2CFC|nr:PhoH family protein [Microbacterium sp. 77mftsu3.1]SDH53418.1 PhoH-like ATPase [Microbacterium sp. 77mftsu3.1]